jgi:amino acid adenylation domain-containing protein
MAMDGSVRGFASARVPRQAPSDLRECPGLPRGWNDTTTDYPRHSTVHALFAEQAARAPEAIAVVHERRRLTYRELDVRSDRLADRLRELGVERESLVAACLGRCPELIVCLLGILKAGGAYVPIDPSAPRKWTELIFAEARPKILVTQQDVSHSMADLGVPIVCPEADPTGGATVGGEASRDVGPESLAYVMFTSGSTGSPKGVCVTHRGIVRLVKRTNYVELGPDEVILQLAPPWFDASTFEIWGSLLNGARLVMMSTHLPTIEELAGSLRRHGVTTLWLPAGLFRCVVDEDPACLEGIRQLLTGGDVVPVAQARRLLRARIVGRLVNGYGPTECTTFSCCHVLTSASALGASVPIGRPIANTRAYVLDERLEPTPAGVAGELFIGGDGVARGYLGRPELTAQRFIPDPFCGEPGARLYRTGDLVRLSPEGHLEFLGRRDDQVKIRGYRVEPSEIEQVLNQHPGVRASRVVAPEDGSGERRLVAYVVEDPEDGAGPRAEALWRDRIRLWQRVYEDIIYRGLDTPGPGRSSRFEITGWDSSYTGLPLTEDEMREQVDQTVQRVLARHPGRLLEVGCGTGLLAFRLIPHLAEYWGTDFCRPALMHIRRALEAAAPGPARISLLERMADDFGGIPSRTFDSVVLNSVIQHFPGVDYSLRVLHRAVEAVRPGGFVFIGDVRSLPLLEAFHASVQLCHAPGSLPTDRLRDLVRVALRKEEEFVIDPALFLAVREHLPRVSGARVRLKRGRHRNELTQFRYDVVLDIEAPAAPVGEIESLDWDGRNLSLSAVERLLRGRRPRPLTIRRVPNARVATGVTLVEILDGPDRPSTVEGLRARLAQETRGRGVDPEWFWELESRTPFRVEIGWSNGERDGRFDVLFTPKIAGQFETGDPPVSPAIGMRPLVSLANDPMVPARRRDLAARLRRYLRENLPEYMVPAAIVPVADLPLTPSGKIDRNALSDIGEARGLTGSGYAPPRSPLEQLIAGIWQDELDLEAMGIDDNFFECGGTSLKAVRVAARLQRAFRVGVSTVALFESPTIRMLGRRLESEWCEVGGDGEADRGVAAGRTRGDARRAGGSSGDAKWGG